MLSGLQEEMHLPIYIGSRSALEMLGAAHNLPQAARPQIYVLTNKKLRVPNWIKNNDWGADFVFRQSSLIRGGQELMGYVIRGFQIKMSVREQAILELIEDLDLTISFESAENYLSSLMTLRPNVMQRLLEDCASLKVKRIFLYLSEKLEMPFFSKLNIETIDLGSGKRVVVKGGRYDKKYQITVPPDQGSGENGF